MVSGMRELTALTWGIVRDHRRYYESDADIYLRIDSEQLPDPESRIVLTGERDPLGAPRIALMWKVSSLEERTINRAATLLMAEVEQRRHGVFDAAPDPFRSEIPWGELKGDSFHMMGGTRMSRDRSSGVVDPNGSVFGVENLFVASTSIFPTGGMANPTLLLICLTLRLADHLISNS